MEEYDIYRDIATRCGGTVFIGVVGPVRTGKSTLIAQMMEKLVLPHLPDGYGKERTGLPVLALIQDDMERFPMDGQALAQLYDEVK